MPASNNIFRNIRYFEKGGETTPFLFKGKEYYLLNISPVHENLPPETPEHAVIADAETHQWSAPLLEGHYFISAYSDPRDGLLYCFAPRFSKTASWRWAAQDLIWTCTEDMKTWSKPQLAIENYPYGNLINTCVTFDGSRYVMLLEVRDTGKPFALRFLESKDLRSWNFIDGAYFRNNITYLGAGAIYYIPEQDYYYITYLTEFTNEATGDLNYATNIARSRDLKTWERGKEPILFPDYSHPIINHPDRFEINAGDAEFLQLEGKVRICGCGGDQLGCLDRFTCEYEGTMAELFARFF